MIECMFDVEKYSTGDSKSKEEKRTYIRFLQIFYGLWSELSMYNLPQKYMFMVVK